MSRNHFNQPSAHSRTAPNVFVVDKGEIIEDLRIYETTRNLTPLLFTFTFNTILANSECKLIAIPFKLFRAIDIAWSKSQHEMALLAFERRTPALSNIISRNLKNAPLRIFTLTFPYENPPSRFLKSIVLRYIKKNQLNISSFKWHEMALDAARTMNKKMSLILQIMQDKIAVYRTGVNRATSINNSFTFDETRVINNLKSFRNEIINIVKLKLGLPIIRLQTSNLGTDLECDSSIDDPNESCDSLSDLKKQDIRKRNNMDNYDVIQEDENENRLTSTRPTLVQQRADSHKRFTSSVLQQKLLELQFQSPGESRNSKVINYLESEERMESEGRFPFEYKQHYNIDEDNPYYQHSNMKKKKSDGEFPPIHDIDTHKKRYDSACCCYIF